MRHRYIVGSDVPSDRDHERGILQNLFEDFDSTQGPAMRSLVCRPHDKVGANEKDCRKGRCGSYSVVKGRYATELVEHNGPYDAAKRGSLRKKSEGYV